MTQTQFMKTAPFIVLSLAVLLAGACDTNRSQEEERSALDKALAEIVALAKSAPCTDDPQCRFVGLGSKACGGPKSYLTYSSSVDTVQLLNEVSHYNAAEAAYNIKWSVISDCSVVAPPDTVICVDGKCTPE
jgi:hypothetical protein